MPFGEGNYFNHSTYSSNNINLSESVCSYLSNCDYSNLIKINQYGQLADLGILKSVTDESNIRMTSDNCISIFYRKQRSESCKNESKKNDKCAIKVLKLKSQELLSYEAQSVNFVEVNPSLNLVLVVTSKNRLSVICLRENKIVNHICIDDCLRLCRWVNDKVIAIVTSKYVFHWNLYESTVICILEIDAKLDGKQIVDYQCEDKHLWFALSTLYLDTENGLINGLVQIYSKSYSSSQCIEAQALTFTRFKFYENQSDSSVLVASKRVSSNSIKLFISELGPVNESNNGLQSKAEVFYCTEYSKNLNDFPAKIVCSSKLGFIYILSKFGSLSICDLESGCNLVRCYPLNNIIISATIYRLTQTPLIIFKDGSIINLELKIHNFLGHLNRLSKKPIIERIIRYMKNFDQEVTRL